MHKCLILKSHAMKNLLTMILAGWLAACQTQSTPTNATENITLTKEMIGTFNQHAWKDMASFYRDTASFLDPSFGSEYVRQTRVQTQEKYAAMEKMFPDIRDDIVMLHASGENVILEFVSSGTSADGSKFKVPICSILTFDDGKIVKDATYYTLCTDSLSVAGK